VKKARWIWIGLPAARGMKRARWVWIGLAVALAVGGLLSLAASPAPDGLERVAENQGFLARAEGKPLLAAPLADYLFPGIADPRLATALAGFLGTMILFALGWGLGWAVRRLRRRGA
jgi:cobalt/nickel transport protein